ncbi:uncharacterized protein LOC107490185 [Arachis duranensis]|uniref:Uncharacterized protein LOC107490185 n=1 Tax=Arachis duranensis TaxID=130453 RepID=A0A6P4DDE5_ARADU|nr:uncharacterized protein LOC107490185 [Arachis duranensis]
MQLKNKLSTFQIEGSVTEYVLLIKGTIDALASVGESVKESDHVNAILHGLSEEYSSVYTSVLARSESITVAELEALLLAHKSMLAKFRKSEAFVQANVAQFGGYHQQLQGRRGGFRKGFRGRGERMHRGGRNLSNAGNMMQEVDNRQANRGGRTYNSRSYEYNMPQCQLCNKFGHTARTCWHRYNEDQFEEEGYARDGYNNA